MSSNLNSISLFSGFLGSFFVISSFLFQLKKICDSKDAEGTSWGLLINQLFTSICFSISAGINFFLTGILNLPFLVCNIFLFLLFIVMCILKVKYKKTVVNI